MFAGALLSRKSNRLQHHAIIFKYSDGCKTASMVSMFWNRGSFGSKGFDCTGMHSSQGAVLWSRNHKTWYHNKHYDIYDHNMIIENIFLVFNHARGHENVFFSWFWGFGFRGSKNRVFGSGSKNMFYWCIHIIKNIFW